MTITIISPNQQEISATSFDLIVNPIKIGVRRILMLYSIIFFPLLLVLSLIYISLNFPQYTFFIIILTISITLLGVYCVAYKKCLKPAHYQLTIHKGTVAIFKNNKIYRRSSIEHLTIQPTCWGNSDAHHPAILLKGEDFPTLSIGSTKYCSHNPEDIQDYTDFLLTDTQRWKDFTQLILK